MRYKFLSNLILGIPEFREDDEGNYSCVISGISSKNHSIRLIVFPTILSFPSKKYSVRERDTAIFLVQIINTQRSLVLRISKDEEVLLEKNIDVSVDMQELKYVISSVSLEDAGLYLVQISGGWYKKETKFTLSVERVNWLHPMCVALTSSSVNVTWTNQPSAQNELIESFWIVVYDFSGKINVSASANDPYVIISNLTGCGPFRVKTVLGTRQSSPITCQEKTSSEKQQEKGRFAIETTSNRVVFVRDGRMKGVCLPNDYVDNEKNRELICHQSENLESIFGTQLQSDDRFVEIDMSETGSSFLKVRHLCLSECPDGRRLNISKCSTYWNTENATLPPDDGSSTNLRLILGSSIPIAVVASILAVAVVICCFCRKKKHFSQNPRTLDSWTEIVDVLNDFHDHFSSTFDERFKNDFAVMVQKAKSQAPPAEMRAMVADIINRLPRPSEPTSSANPAGNTATQSEVIKLLREIDQKLVSLMRDNYGARNASVSENGTIRRNEQSGARSGFRSPSLRPQLSAPQADTMDVTDSPPSGDVRLQLVSHPSGGNS